MYIPRRIIASLESLDYQNMSPFGVQKNNEKESLISFNESVFDIAEEAKVKLSYLSYLYLGLCHR